ncbi:MAG: hypothetical protein D6681_18770 [Calditrichaeota bacterium]|nr:MAG: hypothetical protein D6681_18770 [Calditrichota bacterium]
MKTDSGIGEKLPGLVRLMDDDSTEIQKIIRQEILSHALEIILNKEAYFDRLSSDEIARFTQLLQTLHLDLVKQALAGVVQSPLDEIDLEAALLVISYWDSPDVDCGAVQARLDLLAGEIACGMPFTGHPLGFIDHISQVLFGEYGFRGNLEDYYHPGNSYLHTVLETRLGIPISLSIVYMLIAKRLNFPVFGVGMPAHFILKFDNGEDEIYFDPFYGGRVYPRRACLNYLRQLKVPDPEHILRGCSNLDVFKRVLRNLHLVYSSHTIDTAKLDDIEQFLALL